MAIKLTLTVKPRRRSARIAARAHRAPPPQPQASSPAAVVVPKREVTPKKEEKEDEENEEDEEDGEKENGEVNLHDIPQYFPPLGPNDGSGRVDPRYIPGNIVVDESGVQRRVLGRGEVASLTTMQCWENGDLF